MKKKLAIIILTIAALAALMYGEYRYIMHHISPYTGSNGTVYLEIFGNVDEYYAEPATMEMRFKEIPHAESCTCGNCK